MPGTLKMLAAIEIVKKTIVMCACDWFNLFKALHRILHMKVTQAIIENKLRQMKKNVAER